MPQPGSSVGTDLYYLGWVIESCVHLGAGQLPARVCQSDENDMENIFT